MHIVLNKLDYHCEGSGREHNKNCGQVSIIMRALTSKDEDLIFHFHKIHESESQIENTSLEQLLINNHGVASNQGKIKGQQPLEHISVFCKTF